MQAQQNQKEVNEGRYETIDKRWSVVEDAFRIESQERSQDLSVLKDQLKVRKNQVSEVEGRKGQLISQTLKKLNDTSLQSKQNLQKQFQTQASFRLQHLQTKNDYIKDFLTNGSSFNSTLHQYATNKIKDACGKLELIDNANRHQTELTVKEIKKEVLGEAQVNFQKQKEKYTDLLGKISNDANKELDELRDLLKNRRKQREQSEAKLRLMISSLVQQLSKMSQAEAKEGELTYDCLLKLLEECCSKIQQAQLK